MVKKISLCLLAALYIAAGINHFVHPAAYLVIIPNYFPWHQAINIGAGIAELLLGILVIFRGTRRAAAFGIMILLVLFIPAHIYMIQKGGHMSDTLIWPVWAVWLRLFPLQFLLISWAWWHTKPVKYKA